jgi:transcriptional repressor NF-X1
MANNQDGHGTELAGAKQEVVASSDHGHRRPRSWMGRRSRSRGMTRGRGNPKLAARMTVAESNSNQQLRNEAESRSSRGGGNSSAAGDRPLAVYAIDRCRAKGFTRIAGQRHNEDSTATLSCPESPLTQSRDSHRGQAQKQRNSRKHRTIQRYGIRRYQVNSLDKSKQSIQSGELTEQLLQGSYDCVICCDTIQPRDSVWSCVGCYHIFHLRCIQKWARSSATDSAESESGKKWRCPYCQRLYEKIPSLYFCFCGKVRNPSHGTRETLGYICPHSITA